MHEISILGAMLGTRNLESHSDLFHWLQRDVRPLLPHDILVAAWGGFSDRRISLDVVSSMPGVRTTEALCTTLRPLLLGLFDAWVAAGRVPFQQPLADPESLSCLDGACAALSEMRSVVAHGIRDERGQMDCLYAVLSQETMPDPKVVEAMGMLLPHVDAAFRQVSLLPMQRHDAAGVCADNDCPEQDAIVAGSLRIRGDASLSRREQEIMQWVSVGKTNIEIAQILEISPRTVRNHLQNIFRKLDVMNRAQAVFEVEQFRSGA